MFAGNGRLGALAGGYVHEEVIPVSVAVSELHDDSLFVCLFIYFFICLFNVVSFVLTHPSHACNHRACMLFRASLGQMLLTLPKEMTY
jgi:hypothetical protein